MQAERIAPPPSVRIKVLIRDGHRCVYCGATPETTKIEVDHVIPVSKGGTNDMGNLVAACRECNIGKGANEVLDVMASDVGVYVRAKGTLVAPVPRIASCDPLRENPVAAWIPLFRDKWDHVDLTPPDVVVGTCNDHVSQVLFRPTLACTGRDNSDIGPYPCTVRVLVLPWRAVGEFSDEEKSQTKAAVISGYDVPTIIVIGTPTLFFAVMVNERHKGNPRGQMIDQFLEPFREWHNCGWYPDEDLDFQDLRQPFAWEPHQLTHRRFDEKTENLVGVYCSATGEAL